MTISLFDLFSIGIGPSSSHTVGPMRAAKDFLQKNSDKLHKTEKIKIELYGSLALTGKGHGTDKAMLLGLIGETPETVATDTIAGKIEQIRTKERINLNGSKSIKFTEQDLIFNYDKILPKHPNGMQFSLYDKNNQIIANDQYYSVGGGFILTSYEFDKENNLEHDVKLPYPFKTCGSLIQHCRANNKSIAEIVRANENYWRTDDEINHGILEIWQTMLDSIENGCNHSGKLPGKLKVVRRAAKLYDKLLSNSKKAQDEMSWLSLYAIAVNEENAAGGKVVTAPTNGAAGIIPSVIQYYLKFCEGTKQGIIEFMLTATAIAILYKEGASISAAEVGCQGEVGVACSMAAAGLCAVLGATIEQIENAAEIAMEHNLGLTCDPVAGLVQIPCIERNAIGAVKAVHSVKLSLLGSGTHQVSLDAVIKTMRETGKDMQNKYKETSLGGLAVNLPAC